MQFTLRQRLLLWLVSQAGYLAIRLIGPTLRYSISIEEGGPADAEPHPGIYAFWHRSVFAVSWRFRNHGIAVLTSRSFDGEYIARIITRLGYRAVRGSSSRGAVGGLRSMRRELEAGGAVAFTIDGPRGPRYLAKPGAVMLARDTGMPVTAFYIAPENPWTLRSWDAFMVPKPFSRALLRVSRPVQVPAEARDEELERYRLQLQEALERARIYAEEHVGRKEGE